MPSRGSVNVAKSPSQARPRCARRPRRALAQRLDLRLRSALALQAGARAPRHAAGRPDRRRGRARPACAAIRFRRSRAAEASVAGRRVDAAAGSPQPFAEVVELSHGGAITSAASRWRGRRRAPAPGRGCRRARRSSCRGSRRRSCRRGTVGPSRASAPDRSPQSEARGRGRDLDEAAGGAGCTSGHDRSFQTFSLACCSLSRPKRGSPGRSLITKNQPGSSSGFSPVPPFASLDRQIEAEEVDVGVDLGFVERRAAPWSRGGLSSSAAVSGASRRSFVLSIAPDCAHGCFGLVGRRHRRLALPAGAVRVDDGVRIALQQLAANDEHELVLVLAAAARVVVRRRAPSRAANGAAAGCRAASPSAPRRRGCRR